MREPVLPCGNPTRDGKAALCRPSLAVLLVLCFVLAVPLVSCNSGPLLDRDAMVAFYDATGGAGWEENRGWLSEAYVGRWHGLTAQKAPSKCGDYGAIDCTVTTSYTLNLAGNNLIGKIPPQLGSGGKLTGLNLSENQLSGSIPPELGNLGDLTWLALGGNQLSGEIPPELGDLDRLNLSENQLSGEIPPELGNHMAETQRESVEWRDSTRAGQVGRPGMAVPRQEPVERTDSARVGRPRQPCRPELTR